MLVNPNKLQAILLDKLGSDYTGTKLTSGSEESKIISSFDVLSVTIDDEPNFNLYIDRICEFASNKSM